MAEGLGFPWSMAAAFRILSLTVRDWLYGLVARHRFRIFGRRETCYNDGIP
jgi:predicted DCC family thiol-disulfide oxidoreductase YuxK